jgi:cytochrome c-type biogenesis protein
VIAAPLSESFASTALNGSLLAALGVAFVAGLVSFASPCVVPLVPSYLAYVTGMAGADSSERGLSERGASRPRLVLGALLFVLGFSVVFVLILTGVSVAGAALASRADVIVRVLGVVVILLGLAFMGAVPFLEGERRLRVSPRAGLAGAPLLGAAFGLGWTPCIGPTLAAVATLALSDATVARGAVLAVAYSLGLGVPFVVVALLMERSRGFLAWLRRHRLALMRTGGAILIVLGVLLVTGIWQSIASVMQGWIDGFWVAV